MMQQQYSGLSDCDPGKARAYRTWLFQHVSQSMQVSGVLSLEPSVSGTTIQLTTTTMKDSESSLVDRDELSRLTKSKTINWCRTVQPVYPIRVFASDVSDPCTGLLLTVTTALWGLDDMATVDKVRKLVHVALIDSGPQLRTRWRQVHDIDDTGATLRTDVEVRWQTICSAFSDDHTRRSTASHVVVDRIDPIHVFTLSNILRRPLIVVDGDIRAAAGTAAGGPRDDEAAAVWGVYLPLAHEPASCSRSPVVMATTLNGKRFVPLVFGATPAAATFGLQQQQQQQTTAEPERAFPLVDSDLAQFPVRCLLSPGERPEVAMSRYLRTTEMPMTTAHGVNMIPAARLDAVAPPGEYDMLASWTSSRSVVAGPNHPLLVARGGPTMAGSHWSDDDHVITQCQTPGCEFFGLRQNDGFCSACCSKRQHHQQQQLIWGGSHVPAWQEPGFGFVGVANLQEESAAAVVTSSYGLTSSLICSVPQCTRHVTGDGQLHCVEHRRQPALDPQRPVPVPVSWNPGPGTRQLTGQREAVPCAVPGCELFGLAERANLCSVHYATQFAAAGLGPRKPETLGQQQPSQAQVSTACRNVSCIRQGSPHFNGLCGQCFVIVGDDKLSSPSARSPAASRRHQVAAPGLHGDILMFGLESTATNTTNSSSCIMDFCSNVGLADCKGLCRDCFTTLCQNRLLNDSTPVQQPTIAEERPVVCSLTRCMMDGCRKTARPGELICDSCFTKQQDALAGLKINRSI